MTLLDQMVAYTCTLCDKKKTVTTLKVHKETEVRNAKAATGISKTIAAGKKLKLVPAFTKKQQKIGDDLYEFTI